MEWSRRATSRRAARRRSCPPSVSPAPAARLGEEATLDGGRRRAHVQVPPKTKAPRPSTAKRGGCRGGRARSPRSTRWEGRPWAVAFARRGRAALHDASAANEGEQRREGGRRTSTGALDPGPVALDVFYYHYYDRPRSKEMNPGGGLLTCLGMATRMRTSIRSRSPRPRTRSKEWRVSAEQLAPYLALPLSENADDIIEEGYVLPVVAALDGRATVDDETGAIVYVFDDLVRGATASTSSNEGALAENDIQFSNASQGQLAAAGVLGVANLGVAAAAVFFSTVGVTPAVVASLGPGGLAALRAVAGPLFAYAVAFNALPAARAGRAERGEGRRGAEFETSTPRSFRGRLVVCASSPLRGPAPRILQRWRRVGHSTAYDGGLEGRGSHDPRPSTTRSGPGTMRSKLVVSSSRRRSRAASCQILPTFYPPTYPRRAAVLLGLLKANSRTRKIPEARASFSDSALPTHRAACKRQTHTHNNKTMGAEASAEAGAEVFAEAIGDMCFGLPPGTGMLLRAPIALGAAAAKAAATPKPIHVHIGGGAAVTAAAAAGAASHVSVWRFYAIDATVSPHT